MQKKRINKFITIEGIEGVGKTTAIKVIEDYLMGQQQDFILTREPGGTAIAEHIRKILLTSESEEMTSLSELLLMFASRAQHIAHVILPALQTGKWVISDRFVDASYAYQGGGRKIDVKKIEMLDEWVVGNLQPQLTILLDAPPEVGLVRAINRGPHDRIEQEKIDFFERVRDFYLKRAEQFPDRFYRIDATQSLEEIQYKIREKLNELMTSAHYAN